MEDGRTPELRRMMVEYGEQFWRSGWAPLYGVLGGNPLAAMPSLHFATSVTAAHVLAETGGVAGMLGWTYAARSEPRSSTSGSTTWSTSWRGWHWRRAIRAGAPAAAAARTAGVGRGAGDRGTGARMRDASSAPVRSANPEPPGRRGRRRARLQVTGRNLLVIGGFFAASLAALYYLLPQLAGLQDTWHRIEDGSPWWMLLALRASRSACSRATC